MKNILNYVHVLVSWIGHFFVIWIDFTICPQKLAPATWKEVITIEETKKKINLNMHTMAAVFFFSFCCSFVVKLTSHNIYKNVWQQQHRWRFEYIIVLIFSLYLHDCRSAAPYMRHANFKSTCTIVQLNALYWLGLAWLGLAWQRLHGCINSYIHY